MIYLFYGTDSDKVRAKAFEWVAKARAKEPNLSYTRLTKDEITPAALEDSARSGGLFVKRLLILLDDPFGATEDATRGNELLEEHLSRLADSPNAIVILAPKLVAAKEKKLVAQAKMAYQYDLRVAAEVGRGFNGALVNALASRSREKFWLEVTRALRAGDAPEMLHGLLHWKARDLVEKGGRAWTPHDARNLSRSLISLLQTSRRKGLDLGEALERFALSV